MGTGETTTRRVLLHRSLALVGAGTAGPGFLRRQARPASPARAVRRRAKPGGPNERVLVVVQLAGGNDGLNTVIPVRDDVYYKCRPQVSITRRAALKINDRWSFHPALTGLKSLYDQGMLAIIHGVGYPNPNRSHVKSMNVWHTASPEGRMQSGWIGRYLDHTGGGGDEHRAGGGIALTSEVPLAMCGARSVPVVSELPGCLVDSLHTVARMIASNVPARVYYVSQRGYDTHVGQARRHRQLLAQLGGGLEAFTKDLEATRQLDRVLVMTFSEFGRRVAENASGGTDHGEASVMFVIGQQVQPGLFGRPPGLEKLHRGDLAWTTDFRCVYAAMLEDWLGTQARPILGDAFKPPPIIRRA